jgi:hypothetical protein
LCVFNCQNTVGELKIDQFLAAVSPLQWATDLAMMAFDSLGPQLFVYEISLFSVENYHFHTIYKRLYTDTSSQFSMWVL